MQSLTKAQLVMQLEASHVSYQRLEEQLAIVRAERDMFAENVTRVRANCEAEIARLREHVAAHRYVRPVDRSDYAAKCAAARREAMSTGFVVKVG